LRQDLTPLTGLVPGRHRDDGSDTGLQSRSEAACGVKSTAIEAHDWAIRRIKERRPHGFRSIAKLNLPFVIAETSQDLFERINSLSPEIWIGDLNLETNSPSTTTGARSTDQSISDVNGHRDSKEISSRSRKAAEKIVNNPIVIDSKVDVSLQLSVDISREIADRQAERCSSLDHG
jgi:hypothetical protein